MRVSFFVDLSWNVPVVGILRFNYILIGDAKFRSMGGRWAKTEAAGVILDSGQVIAWECRVPSFVQR